MGPIKPFQINVSDAKLDLLKRKLELATLPDEVSGAGHDMGTRLEDVERLTAYWKDGFDWRAQEKKLNEIPQFTTIVEVPDFGELDIHFIHQKSKVENAVPLLFIHGWPGSFLEAVKILPLLTQGDEDAPAFHVVAPSLPNFGFSEGAGKKGFGLKQYAQTLHSLMQTLGYEQYVTQGGDWGSFLSRVLGRLYPNHVKASHINLVISAPPYPWKAPLIFLQSLAILFSARDKAGLKHSQTYQSEGNGYLVEQDSKPQTIGYALADSPTALLAWIYEKLVTWTDKYPWTDDEILTWISIYQFSRAGPAASVRIYYESTHPGPGGISRQQSIYDWVPNVKLGLAYFPAEIIVLPKSWGHQLGPVVQQTDFEKGGHFAAFERPGDLAGDVKKMFGKGGGAFGVVDGKSGYN